MAVLILATMIMMFTSGWRVQSEQPPPSCANTSRTLLVLPGSGWDALSNNAKAPVIDVSYENCYVTPDRLYLVPDDVVIESVSSGRVPLFSELFRTWPSYTSVIARRLNDQQSVSPLGAPTSIEGSFSRDVVNAKSRMIGLSAVIARTYARHHMFTLHLGHATKLNEDLATRLQEADAHFEKNNVQSARSVLEHIVADYGTHYTTQVDIGAMIVEENDIRRQLIENYPGNVSDILQAANLMFLRMIDFRQNDNSPPTSTQTQWLELYKSNRLNSFVETFGGPPLKSNMSLDVWSKEVPLNPGAVGQRGEPLVYAVSQAHLRGMSYKSLRRLRQELHDVISKYYLFNTHVGCTDIGSENFEYSVNIGDASCPKAPSPPESFGGTFQNCFDQNGGDVCQMLSLNVKNIATDDFSCPPMFNKRMLIQDNAYRCRQVCNETGCYDGCFRLWTVSCYSTEPQKLQMSFGGVYSTVLNNPMTGHKMCPPPYVSVLVGEHMYVCTANSLPNETQYAIPFGGFFSFDMYNTTQKVQSCLPGFSRHTADILDPSGTVDSKVIVYCARFRNFPEVVSPSLVAPLFQTLSFVYNQPTPSPSVYVWSAGAIAAVVLGILLLLVIIVLIVGSFALYRLRRASQQSGSPSERTPILASPQKYQSLEEAQGSETVE